MGNNKVWYITGANRGLALTLIQKLLHAGECVTAVSGDSEALAATISCADPCRFMALQTDMNDTAAVCASVAQTITRFGRIDVVVNNAGEYLTGTLEELAMEEVMANFEANVFGTMRIIQAVLPCLRKQRSGHIFTISSEAGFTNQPGTSVYTAAQFALEGLSESLAQDTRQFGIHVTHVIPGTFSTPLLEEEQWQTPENPITEYTAVRRRERTLLRSKPVATGDVCRAAAVIMEAAAAAQPPLHLFLGADAYQQAFEKIATLQKDLYQWRQPAIATTAAERLTEGWLSVANG